MSVCSDVVTVRRQRVATGAGHGFVVPMMGGHFSGVLGRAVRTIVLASERERARRNHQVQPENAEHGEQPAGRRTRSFAVIGRRVQDNRLPKSEAFCRWNVLDRWFGPPFQGNCVKFTPKIYAIGLLRHVKDIRNGRRKREMTGNTEISLRHLSKSFSEGRRQHRVLDDVSADFLRGETIAVRGRSGSGKSTLLNLVGGIDTPDAGRVVVAGVDLTGLSERDRTLFRREHIGFVYQAFNLVPTLDVADNIRLVLELNGVPPRESQDRIEELLEAVGLADRADSYPDVLSGGEQQRVAIARALCHEPAVVIADEPTGNLDDSTADVVLALLDRLVRERGGTMLIATHSARVAAVCDREIEIHGGKLATPAQVRDSR